LDRIYGPNGTDWYALHCYRTNWPYRANRRIWTNRSTIHADWSYGSYGVYGTYGSNGADGSYLDGNRADRTYGSNRYDRKYWANGPNWTHGPDGSNGSDRSNGTHRKYWNAWTYRKYWANG